MKPSHPDLLQVDQVSELLGVSTRTIRHYVRSGYLPALKLGGRVLFRRESIERALAEIEASQSRQSSRGHELEVVA